MSVEPQALERSVLESKDREELSTIAAALGLKTTARASKATLVDQILVGIGVEEPKPKKARAAKKLVEGDGAPSDPASDKAERDRAKPAKADAAVDESDGDTSAGDAAAGAANPAEAAVEAPTPPTETGADTATAAIAPDDRRTAERQGRPEGQGQQQQQQQRSPQPQQQQSQQNQQNQQNQQHRPQQQQQDDDAGNRRSRRRRRGRDRDRDFMGQEGSENVPFTGEPVEVQGLLDLRDEGFGFLRTKGYLPSANDIYVSVSQVRRFALRKGDYLKGASRPASQQEKYPALLRIDSINDLTPDEARQRPKFEDLTPLFPDERLHMEVPGEPHNVQSRIVDLISPIGKGQRGLIVSPPKAGKTTVMKQIARSIEANNPEVHLIVLLVDERPEEVTDWRKWMTLPTNEVVASTFDRPSDEHTQVAELTIERAKRLVEMGQDVAIVLDGITRLARAYNLAAPATGRIMSGGVDSGALYPPKKFFGAARNVEEGGSLTILATALVETGSRMDEVIFEEFKGTGNMELRLDRRMAERRIYPAIDVNASSTRHEELLFERKQLEMVWRLRRVLNGLAEGGSNAAGLELLMDKIKTTKSNDEFLSELAKGPHAA
jgi:transcription termination factor Rho